ncbi:S8 family peptidase [Massilia brevitalea]|uniref:S8 family peptidase n=1 Tax=Massilia brevitalea TaxID=442526 RepID=UPI002738F16C|nr:S8 family serine peptidase [Massilia brevitalea]
MSKLLQTEYMTFPKSFSMPMSNEGFVLSSQPAGRVDEAFVTESGANFLNESSIDGVVLLRASATQKAELESNSGLKLFENREYELPQLYPLDMLACETADEPFDGSHEFRFLVVDESDKPLPGVAFVIEHGLMFSKAVFSNDLGEVSIQFGLPVLRVLHVRPPENYWPLVLRGRSHSNDPVVIRLTAIDLSKHERYAELLGIPLPDDGLGVKIAVIDTGVSRHIHLTAVKKRYAVSKGVVEDDNLREPDWHGTHVAGIIGCSHNEVLGHASAADIVSYRVCPAGKRSMSTADVVVAILDAVSRNVDIINLSLGFNASDEAIAEAISYAHSSGVLVVAAVGNDAKEKCSFPASVSDVVAVTALGRVEAYPFGSSAALQMVRASSGDFFTPYFANFGEAHVGCAAPGVGIVSTVNESGYQAESGTSMAAPIVSALSATLLSRNLSSLGARTPERLSTLRDMLYTSCTRAGFHAESVGHGVPFVR